MSVVSYELNENIGVIRINNPPVNALSHELRAAIQDAVNAAQADQSKAYGRRSRSDNDEPLDLSELPRFQAPDYTFKEAVAPTIVDMGLLALYSLLAFAGGFVAFLRYDVR